MWTYYVDILCILCEYYYVDAYYVDILCVHSMWMHIMWTLIRMFRIFALMLFIFIDSQSGWFVSQVTYGEWLCDGGCL